MTIALEPIGFVSAARTLVEDDFWGGSEACIALTGAFSPEALLGLADFSHVEVLFYFHKLEPEQLVTGARRPRGNPAWPVTGIFAQRAKYRPSRIGSTTCRVARVEGTRLYVTELDALDGTPVLDLKPVFQEFLPRGEIRQPDWSRELMRDYWSPGR